MERDELAALIRDIFGPHATDLRVETILLAADAHAALIATRQRELLEAGETA